MYRFARFHYDLTRRYYLVGREQMLGALDVSFTDRVLEVGCGTARNLIHLARRAPQPELFGLDASPLMLRSAEHACRRAGCDEMVTLRQGLAEQLDYRTMFDLDEPFDAIFFSFSLSLMPTWREALDAAIRNLKPGGTITIVDFWDQHDLPSWFRALFRWWLGRYNVLHGRMIADYVGRVHESVEITPIFRRYAFLARIVKS